MKFSIIGPVGTNRFNPGRIPDQGATLADMRARADRLIAELDLKAPCHCGNCRSCIRRDVARRNYAKLVAPLTQARQRRAAAHQLSPSGLEQHGY